MKIPFDQYQRYKKTSEIINLVREEGQVFSILEVGANEHKNLEHFLVRDQITYLDIQVPDHLKEDPSYIEGDATDMPFEDGQYDYIIALDVFEHIPRDRRELFLSELNRVSRLGFILAAPFDTLGVSESENRVNLYFKTIYGFNYQWLEEHLTNKLPNITDTMGFFNDKGWYYYNFSHGSLTIWEIMTKLHFLAAGKDKLYDYRFTIDDYYNQHLCALDYSDPCYRNFFVVSKSKERLNIVSTYFETHRKNSINEQNIKKLKEYEDSFEKLAIYDSINGELSQKNVAIEQKNKELAELKDNVRKLQLSLTEKEQNLLTSNQHTEQLKVELNQAREEIDRVYEMNTNEINELEKQVNELVKNKNDIEIALDHEKKQYDKGLNDLNIIISNQQDYIAELEQLAQSLRIKNRFKKYVKKVIPLRLVRKGKSTFSLVRENPQLLKKGFIELRKNGMSSLKSKLNSKLVSAQSTQQYEVTIPTANYEDIYKEIEQLEQKPLISIIMPVYNVEIKWIEAAIASVTNQLYTNWELCIVDDCSSKSEVIDYLKSITDPRIKIKLLDKNLGIAGASNEAVEMSAGEYLALLDNDDEYTVDALFENVKVINRHNADIIYSDEDKIDIQGNRKFPFYKPDWSPDLLRSQMYIGHLLVFKKSLFLKVGGFRAEFNGSQDYDLILRMSEVADNIYHIPKVLYSWRELETSTALNPHSKPYAHYAGIKALSEHLERVYGKDQAWVNETEHMFVYDCRYKLEKNTCISIIIPIKDKIELLDECVKSIFAKTKYSNYEILVMNNNSVEPSTFEWFEKHKSHPQIRIIEANYEFNWSKLNNHGINEAKGDVFVFLNNDTIVISEDWLVRLAEKAQRPDVGTVGALLLYEDQTIQHAGVVVGLGGWADHIFKGMEAIHFGSPFVSPMLTRNVIASTGACLAISRSKIEKIGLFDENFIICGSDVEISLRALKYGFVNVFDPYVKLYHLESKSRDSFVPECDFQMSALHYGPYLQSGDPYFNKNLDYYSVKPTLKLGE